MTGRHTGDPVVRLAARVVLLHANNAVLLQLHDWPHEPHWPALAAREAQRAPDVSVQAGLGDRLGRSRVAACYSVTNV
ncbi:MULTISPECIES: hypothetical protein [unclassified Pseudofrankia]|uniref:hypothetical protein n=1 Tax=unclassified Pseudofrankia TaxID=2994372 RepID=UPI0008DAECC7|nr:MULTISPECIES: hypothetical protein [unclassified Pseudofrankia]MDT3440884.1 hypothetical protein [Pseudofrankia sp. BMG5.37]OHV65760.1 hypothetical protein BCD48_36185 [Pseudofrankia sp. BMG5.36]